MECFAIRMGKYMLVLAWVEHDLQTLPIQHQPFFWECLRCFWL